MDAASSSLILVTGTLGSVGGRPAFDLLAASAAGAATFFTGAFLDGSLLERQLSLLELSLLEP